jgi:hypothetical protein
VDDHQEEVADGMRMIAPECRPRGWKQGPDDHGGC